MATQEKNLLENLSGTATTIGDVFDNCIIIEENERHYYLESNGFGQWFDIVLPKYTNDCYDDESKFLNLKLKIGDMVTVTVYTINIADDGVPGAFVTFIEKHGIDADETESEEPF